MIAYNSLTEIIIYFICQLNAMIIYAGSNEAKGKLKDSGMLNVENWYLKA